MNYKRRKTKHYIDRITINQHFYLFDYFWTAGSTLTSLPRIVWCSIKNEKTTGRTNCKKKCTYILFLRLNLKICKCRGLSWIQGFVYESPFAMFIPARSIHILRISRNCNMVVTNHKTPEKFILRILLT